MSRDTGFFDRSVIHGGVEYRFNLYVPSSTRDGGKLPGLLFLHGRGECGHDGLLPLSVGLPIALMKSRSEWPFAMVIPQKREQEENWFDYREMLDKMLAQAEEEVPIDPHRRYLTGLSQGGHGTFRLAKHLSWQFAAIAPVCGWVDPEVAAKELRDMALWAFHGEKDNVVPASRTIEAIDAIRKAGGNPKLTLYPELTHNSWDEAYQKAGLSEWLLSHSLGE